MTNARLHLCLLIVLAFELAGWAASRGDAEAHPGAGSARVAAWHVAANRGNPNAALFDSDFVAARLAELDAPGADLRSALYPFTNDVCRLTGPRPQLEWVVEALSRPVDRRTLLAVVLQLRKTGGAAVGASGAMSAVEWRWAAQALSEAPWPDALARAIQAHFAPLREQLVQYLAR